MGVDCSISFPSRVRLHDVADVVAILCGAKAARKPLRGCDGAYYAHIEGLKVKGCDSPAGCATIIFEDQCFLYHFEFGDFGERGIMPRSTAENIAMCKRLADFFGGRVDFSDCDSTEVDYFVEEQPDINASNGAAWQRLQDCKLAVQPLTDEEIAACEKFAAYKGVK